MVRCPSFFFLHMFQKRTFRGRCHRFSRPRCPSCHPTNSVKALKETQSTDPNQVTWPRSFFIHYRTPEWKGVSLLTPKRPTPVQCLSVAIHATHVQVCGAAWKNEINIFIFKLCSTIYVRSRGTHMHANDLFSVTSWQCNRTGAECMNIVMFQSLHHHMLPGIFLHFALSHKWGIPLWFTVTLHVISFRVQSFCIYASINNYFWELNAWT